jgi:hypothetical protein
MAKLSISKERAQALYQAAIVAGGLLLDTPFNPAKAKRGTAYVSYDALARLNAALVKAGFDMDKARAGYDRVAARQKERQEAIARWHAKMGTTPAGEA